jgi:ABC-type polar amino acid transport system ATPase subunit
MPIALELSGVTKRFVAGTATCNASVDALSFVDLTLRAGEAAAVIGGPGAGKSTLLLCAAGLLRADSGGVSWFGERDRRVAALRATYYFPGGVPRPRVETQPHIHLVDGPNAIGPSASSGLRKWIDSRLASGDAILIAARSPDVARDVVTRIVYLRAGRICADERSPAAARVAETPFAAIAARND